MATFAQVPTQGNPDSWINLDLITHVKPNGDGTDIFMFGGLRVTTMASPDTVMLEHHRAEAKFLKLLVVTRWTGVGGLETKHGWLNIGAVAHIQPSNPITDIHLQDGSMVSTPNSVTDLMGWIDSALHPRRNDALMAQERRG